MEYVGHASEPKVTRTVTLAFEEVEEFLSFLTLIRDGANANINQGDVYKLGREILKNVNGTFYPSSPEDF